MLILLIKPFLILEPRKRNSGNSYFFGAKAITAIDVDHKYCIGQSKMRN